MRPHWQRRGVALAGSRAWPRFNNIMRDFCLFWRSAFLPSVATGAGVHSAKPQEEEKARRQCIAPCPSKASLQGTREQSRGLGRAGSGGLMGRRYIAVRRPPRRRGQSKAAKEKELWSIWQNFVAGRSENQPLQRRSGARPRRCRHNSRRVRAAYNALRHSSGPCRRGRGCPRRRGWRRSQQRGPDPGRKSFCRSGTRDGVLTCCCVPRTRQQRPCASALISRTTTATGSSTAPTPTAQPAAHLKLK